MFEICESELVSGAITATALAEIVAEIEDRGFAVVAGLVSSEACELLRSSILEDAQLIQQGPRPTPHEKATGIGHLQLGLRRYVPFVPADLVANALIEQVVGGLLGRGAWLGFYNGNVNLPGSEYQPLHFDRPFSWRSPQQAAADGQPWPPPTTTLSCSVALSAITESNGATQVYPGSHRETAVTQWSLSERIDNHPELLSQWGPPVPLEIPAGGVCFRDPRMWHGGVPNPSSEIRPMLALTYHAHRCLHWRGRLLKKMSSEEIAQCQQDPTLKMMEDGVLGDGRLVFDAGVEEVLAELPSFYGINRNLRFATRSERVDHFLDAHLVGGARVVPADSAASHE